MKEMYICPIKDDCTGNYDCVHSKEHEFFDVCNNGCFDDSGCIQVKTTVSTTNYVCNFALLHCSAWEVCTHGTAHEVIGSCDKYFHNCLMGIGNAKCKPTNESISNTIEKKEEIKIDKEEDTPKRMTFKVKGNVCIQC